MSQQLPNLPNLSTMSKIQPKNSKTATEQLFKAFSKIVDFVSELNNVFGARFHEVAAYNFLLSKTKVSQKLTIQRHIDIFKDFFNRNREALLNKDVSKITSHQIAFSKRAFLDIHTLLTQPELDNGTTDAIWTHLLVINTTIDPSSEARDILRQLQGSGTAEGEFLDGFFNRIQQSVETSGVSTADPMTAATTILQSGVLNDLVGSIDKNVKDGSLDIGRLIGTVQGMLGSLSSMGGQAGSDANSEANPMAGLDIGGMLNMMMSGGLGGMMSQIAQGPQSSSSNSSSSGSSFGSGLQVEKVQAQIDAQIAAEAKREAERLRPREILHLETNTKIEVMDDDKMPAKNSKDESKS